MEHSWNWAQVGSGGLYSNIVDLARWEAAFDDGRIGPPGFRDFLLERGTLDNGETVDYAFGLYRRPVCHESDNMIPTRPTLQKTRSVRSGGVRTE